MGLPKWLKNCNDNKNLTHKYIVKSFNNIVSHVCILDLFSAVVTEINFSFGYNQFAFQMEIPDWNIVKNGLWVLGSWLFPGIMTTWACLVKSELSKIFHSIEN